MNTPLAGTLNVTATYRSSEAFSRPLGLGLGQRIGTFLRYLTQTASVPVLINAPPLSEKETAGRTGSQTISPDSLNGGPRKLLSPVRRRLAVQHARDKDSVNGTAQISFPVPRKQAGCSPKGCRFESYLRSQTFQTLATRKSP